MSRVRGIMTENPFSEIGLKLKNFREDAKLTQTQAAEKIGVTKTTISRWETGRVLPLDINFDKICKAYRIPHSYLNFISTLADMNKNQLIKMICDMFEESDPHSPGGK